MMIKPDDFIPMQMSTIRYVAKGTSGYESGGMSNTSSST